ncbi:hypothetical protein [Enterococcus nangangensis]|uniref:hypothetical protein n=1 Tax=Enterococcus nangangensis TaxID=2559926 RepID=UPI0010F51E52|nr:hypothetical protein [Enterococcus nangangensis]
MKKNQLKVITLILVGMLVAWMGNRNLEATILVFFGSLITLCAIITLPETPKEARLKRRRRL